MCDKYKDISDDSDLELIHESNSDSYVKRVEDNERPVDKDMNRSSLNVIKTTECLLNIASDEESDTDRSNAPNTRKF